MKPEATRAGALSMQVCVPVDYSDDQAKEFAESEHPCGTRNGWFMRQDGDEALSGCLARAPCEERDGFVHIMFDA